MSNWTNKLARMKQRKNPDAHPDLAADKQLIEQMVKADALKKQAFERGFIKAAQAAGLSASDTVTLLKRANDPLKASMLEGATAKGLLGAGLGAGVGGVGGYFLGRDKENPEKDHGTTGAILGGIAGAGLGGVGGAYYGANQGWHKGMTDILTAQSKDNDQDFQTALSKIPKWMPDKISNPIRDAVKSKYIQNQQQLQQLDEWQKNQNLLKLFLRHMSE